MKKEIILKEWQNDIVRDDSKIIMANISRGGSKTFLLANKVIYEKPKTVLYINCNPHGLRYLREHFIEISKLDDYINDSVISYHASSGSIVIIFTDGERITIYDRKSIPEGIEIDMVLFDDGLPELDIKAKKYVSMFTIKYPIMNFFNCRKDISYYVIGIKKLEESGYLTKKQIQDTRTHLGEVDFDKYFDLCNEYKDMFKEDKPVRGLRRNANLYEESVGDFKANNIYLTQKERNVIRCDIESTLHKFESEVDNTLRNNELELAKINHNVVDACKSILNKLQVADFEDPNHCKYYLTIDISRDGDNNAILFQDYEGELKIAKFISFDEKDFEKVANRFIDEIKPLNGQMIIPTACFGMVLIDYLKKKGFDNIIEMENKELGESNGYNVEILNNKNKLYKLLETGHSNKKYLTEFVELFRQLNNLQIKVECGNIAFDKKDKDISNCWITNVFYTLSKLKYKL